MSTPAASDAQDAAFMHRALKLAQQAWGQTHPNPMVGAVIVEDGKIVAEGYHARAGQAHAEVQALRALGRIPAAGATLYVTLEPCSTTGRTGACTDAIMEAGLRRVVVGAEDPNPAHAGKGLELLRAQGIEVRSGVMERECRDLNLIFNHAICHQAPLIAAKVATTLDGKIATRSGHSQWITGEAARADVMRWRRLFPAIAVGAGTVLADNPRLTSRLSDQEHCPLRLIFDRQGRTFAQAESLDVYTDAFAEKTCVITTAERCKADAARRLTERGVRLLPLAEDLPSLWRQLYEETITGVWVEGGSGLLSELLQQKQLYYLFQYIAPKLIADSAALAPFTGQCPETMPAVHHLTDAQTAVLGEDVLVRGHLMYPQNQYKNHVD